MTTGTTFDGLAQWAILLICAFAGGFIAGRFAPEDRRVRVSAIAFFFFVLVFFVLGFVLECTFRPGGCDG